MNFKSIREFIQYLENNSQLKKVNHPVSPNLEITEISDRVLKSGGTALLFTNPDGHKTPILTNLFGSTERIALALGCKNTSELREIGELLAFMKEPIPPESFKDAIHKFPLLKRALKMSPKIVKSAPCHDEIFTGDNIDLGKYPIQTCWPKDAAPLITWGVTITKGPYKNRENLGIYRLQVIEKNRLIMRWLSHRGGAIDFQQWQKENPEKPFPVSIAISSPPAVLISAVTPIPDTISEFSFAGLLSNSKTEIVKCKTNNLHVPATSEIVIEGEIKPDDYAIEGPFADHTGYYNEQERFPVVTITAITQRKNPIYHSTYTGRPPDEPAVLGAALNEVFIPILQKQFPEICDFYLPPEGCSYRMAIVTIKKEYPGHARRIMFGIWSYLRQFMYTKYIVVTDEDINPRNWEDVIWAITTRTDPQRDMCIIDQTPIDYLDFASPVAGIGSKIGIDATNKWTGETNREWGIPVQMSDTIKEKIDSIWNELNL